MTTFDNHPPINLESAEKLASASRDGGAYSGIGYDNYRVWKGKRYHLIHRYSSGCEYNNRVDHSSNHLGSWNTIVEVIAHLLTISPKWWADELLEELGYAGEEA